VIPISTPELKALVEELKADFKKVRNTENLVFTCDGQRIEPMLLRRALQKACKEAVFIDEKGNETVGIQNFTLHDFRHCAITRWHKMKVPVATAMAMAGHSSVSSHKNYINMDAQQHAEVFTNCLREHSTPAKKSA